MKKKTIQFNMDFLTELVKVRLQSTGKVKTTGPNGSTSYIEVEVIDVENIKIFLDLSLAEFNQTPKFTDFSFEDSKFINDYRAILVDGAVLHALSSQALLERGREFGTVDAGIEIYPAAVSDALLKEYEILSKWYWIKLRYIKQHMSS